MSVTMRPYKRGGWEVDIRVVSPDGARQIRERKRAPMSSRTTAMRWAESRERVMFQRLMDPAQQTGHRKEVPTLRDVRAPLHGRSRASQSSEAERNRVEGDDPARVSAAGVRTPKARRDQKRGRAASQARTADEITENGEQHPGRAQRAAEEGRGVGRDRTHAVHGQAAAGAERLHRIPRLRRVRTTRRSGAQARCADAPHRPAGRRGGLAVRRDGCARVDGRRSSRTGNSRSAGPTGTVT